MFVSEIGINHKGDENRAFEILKKLVNTNVDGITFQVRNAVFYNKVKSWGGPLRNEFYKEAIQYIHENGNGKRIGFAVEDQNMIPILDSYGADFWKLLSISITDPAIQDEFQKTGKHIFVSTGTADEQTVLEVSKRLKNITLLQTQLSQELRSTNLNAINRLRYLTNKAVGFGLHCAYLDVLYLSVAFNPSDLFFYVKENTTEKYPEDSHAFTIDKVDELIQKVKNLELALGNEVKEKMESCLK